MILDYELKQIETIFELVNQIIPKELNFSYVFIPYILDIKELENGKLLLIEKKNMMDIILGQIKNIFFYYCL